MRDNTHTRADGTTYDPTGTCPDCGRRQGWDGHGYDSCTRLAEAARAFQADVVEKRADELRPGDELVRLGMIGEVLATHVGRTVLAVTAYPPHVRVTFTDGTTVQDDGSGLVAVVAN